MSECVPLCVEFLTRAMSEVHTPSGTAKVVALRFGPFVHGDREIMWLRTKNSLKRALYFGCSSVSTGVHCGPLDKVHTRSLQFLMLGQVDTVCDTLCPFGANVGNVTQRAAQTHRLTSVTAHRLTERD